MIRGKYLFRIMIITIVIVSVMNIQMTRVFSATNQFKGVNWADPRDNFVNGNLYPSGLSSTDTYASAATVADRVVGQFVSMLGANSVRMPINEATINGSYWNTYTGAIDKALSYGTVVLCYWSWTRGVPQSMTDWWDMWTKVVNKYGSNPNCYFEVFNEPNMYNATDLCNLYNEWVNVRFPGVPKGRIILDGAGLAQNVPAVGSDSRLSSCLLAVHEYSFFTSSYTTESQWQSHFQGYVGSYASRTVCTEWGYPNSPGSKNGVNYDYIDYLASSGGSNYFYYYARGISKQLRSWNMGSFYWPGLRDGDWYSMTTKTGSDSSINLSIPNASGLYWLQYAWGSTGPSPTPGPTPTPVNYIRLRNAATGLYIDGMGRTSNGSNACQWGDSGSTNQQWTIITSGSYVMIQNRATGLYLDGMGRTSNGSICGQWASSGSTNQQWTQETGGSYVRFKNRATGLYLDGMGSTSNSSNLCQWSNSGSSNQQWQIQ